MDDRPVGRVADVERLLQLLALLRNNAGDWVPHATLRTRVDAYCDSAAGDDAVSRMLQRDLGALRELGFVIDGETSEGTPARYRLRPTAWRVPLALDRDEERLLAWVMLAAGATDDEPTDWSSSLPAVLRGESLGSLLGTVPSALDVVHRALAARRRVRILHNDEEKEIEPAQLTVQNGRWFLIARFVGAGGFYGWRLDRLEVVGLGDPIVDEIVAPDPLSVVDNTAWDRHKPIDVELRCANRDAERVVGWFRRANITQDGDETVMRMTVTNTDALVDRVLRFGGAVRVVSPADVVAQIRERAQSFVGAAS